MRGLRAGRRGRRRMRPGGWQRWARPGLEVVAVLGSLLVGIIIALGPLAEHLTGTGLWSHLLPFAGAVLLLGIAAAALLRGWLAVRPWLAARGWLTVAAAALGLLAAWSASTDRFHDAVTSLRVWVGGPAEVRRMAIAHQVYAAYRRADLDATLRLLERSRVYEPTVREAAAAFGVNPEVLMGVGSAESGFYPRDSADGGRGLFQLTSPPGAAVTSAERLLRVRRLDPLNQRHNAFVAAATLRRYLDEMAGDPFLGLLAYNIGPRNGGLRTIMQQYGASDFVTIQPYLQHLPRDYPIRVLAAALAYRLWRVEGRLPRYEDEARRIQRVGIPGLTAEEPAG